MNVHPGKFACLVVAGAAALLLGACQREEGAAPAASAQPAAAATPAPTPTETRESPMQPAASEPVGATAEEVARAYERLDDAAKTAAAQWEGKTFEEFLATVYKEPGEGGKYIVNGDIAIANIKQLEEFFKAMKSGAGQTAGGKLIVSKDKLIVNAEGGRDTVWNAETKRNLTYCVSSSFGLRQAQVVADMEAATGAWEQSSNVDFRHVAGEDGNCTATNANVVFDVRPTDVNGQYLARAFFPNEPRRDRNVLIDETSFDLDPDEKLTLVGILRHELGHTLGWRHEHTRPESGKCFEDTNWRPLSDYDRFSVMHYPQCNGGGDWSLDLTDMDRIGSACIYGAATGFTAPLPAGCPALVAPPAGTAAVVSFANQSVTLQERKDYGPFPVAPGSRIEVVMHGAGATAGDPDLYVRFARKPLRTNGRFDCRPFLVGAEESCTLDVPELATSQRKAFVMVYGYAAGSYSLEVKHVPPN